MREEGRHDAVNQGKLGPCPSGLPLLFLLAFSRGCLELVSLFAQVSISSIVPEGRMMVSFSFLYP